MAQTQPARSHMPRIIWLLLPPLALAIITALVYYPSWHYDFQFDDIANIKKHFDIRHHTFSRLFFSGSRWISYWLNAVYYSICKFDPFLYRVGNCIIHIVNGMLLYSMLTICLPRVKNLSFFKSNARQIAFATTALFLLHPVQTQTVSYVIQGQLEGIASLCILSMINCFLLFTSSIGIAKYIFTALFYVFAVLSCGTKEIAIISPLLIVLVDWFFVAQGNMREIRKRWLYYVVLSVIILSIYLYFLKPTFFTNILSLQMVAKNNTGNVITGDPTTPITTWSFFISQFKVILHYLAMFIWPFSISVEYDWMLCAGFFTLDCLLPLSILLTAAYFIFTTLRAVPTHPACFAALWFFMCIAPRSSIIPSPELLVDYKTYLASAGWLLLLATGLVRLLHVLFNAIRSTVNDANARHAQLACASILILLLSGLTIERNTIWRSGLDFWSNIIQNAPGKARAYNNYGVELSQGFYKFKESIAYFKKAISMDSNYADPCNNLAVANAQIGDVDGAIQALIQGLKINPYYPEGYNNLASFFIQKGEFDKAKASLEKALLLRPHYGKAHFNMGRVAMEKGDKDGALEWFRKACMQADLDDELGFSMYAKVAMGMNKYEEAIFAWTKTLEMNPQHPDGMFNLANCYYLTQKYDKALKLYESLVFGPQQDDEYVMRSWFNLGETYYQLEKPREALAAFDNILHAVNVLPQIRLRRASCYEKLGERENIIGELQALINAPVADNFKQAAQSVLAQYNAPAATTAT